MPSSFRQLKNQFGSFCEEIGRDFQDPEGRTKLLHRLLRALKLVLWALFLVFTIGAAIFLLAVDWIGERNIFSATFLYVPPQIWIIPLLILLAPSVIFARKLALLIVVVALAFVGFYLDWELGGDRAPEGGAQLTVLSFNRGGRDGSLRPFKNHLEPDVLLLQEARRKAKDYLRAEGYSELPHADDTGEFTLLSKFPITGKRLLSYPVADGIAEVGARFEIDFHGTPVALYNIHLRTPRAALKSMRRGAFLWGLIAPMGEKRKFYQSFWDEQTALAEAVIADLEAEPLPFVVAGDFNTPDRGYIHRKFASRLEDCHEAAGKGFGYSFPGVTRNPLSLFKPWLRLDKVFAGGHWRTLSSEVEPHRRTEHLAVGARLELRADQ